ncbi:MAG TPA: pyridoxamine 5'-phosphate oxidase family protein, partial [Parafilimonas sp.]|nr:pyridoxamine 5'-phosphate oxidase family protein [Parafilimonas sp.]
VYAHAEEGMKINMMRENPHVCFEVDTIENMGNWKSVIGWGDYEELTEETERALAINVLLNRGIPKGASKTSYLTPEWPFHSKSAADIEGIVFRIKLNIKTGRFERGDTVSHNLA